MVSGLEGQSGSFPNSQRRNRFLTGSGISVIVPVIRETGIINDLISHLRSIEGGAGIEIIVVDGSNKNDTINVIEDPDVIKVTSPMGRGLQMNTGAGKANGDILLFLHADTRLPSGALRLIGDTLKNERISAGAFTLALDEAPLHLRMMVPINNLRGKLTRIPYGDQAIFVRKGEFERIGGYDDLRIMEDLELMRRMRRSGIKIRILKERVITSSRRFMNRGPLKTIFINIFLISLFHLGVDNERLARIYYGN
jgi:rSAM/selenodomain-associated transferase 2